VDDAMGTIRDALKRLKLEGNTIVIFTSDNGGLVGPTDNSPLRAGKGSAYEGGVRVPLIVLWPGKTPAGQVESDPVITMDLYPTILEMTGIRALPSVVDGMSLVGLLQSGEKLKRDALFWHYPHYHPGGSTPHSAIRSGDYRLVHFYEDGHDELYRVTTDPGERKDRMSSEPEKAKELRNRLEAWLKSVDAQFPVPNR
jgi:arylsulfatase A-like enzyme